MPIRVIVIEDHPLMLKAIVQELKQDDIQVVAMATHGSELQSCIRDNSPDVVILDLGMSTGKFEPLTAVNRARETYPQVQILILTGYDDGIWVRKLIAAGVRGYVLKSDDLSLCLPQAVRAVYRGERFYSPTVTQKYFSYEDASALTIGELALLRLSAQGLSNARIAHELGLSTKTVRNCFSNIYSKLDLHADEGTNLRVAAINRAKELGLLTEP